MNFREMRFPGKSIWVEVNEKNKQAKNGYRITTEGDKYLLTLGKSEIQYYNSFAGAVHAAIEHKSLNV